MKRNVCFFLLALVVVLLLPWARLSSAPYEDGKFKGRIAWSCDGNDNDPDDWIASPVALAIFAEMGFKSRLVHFDYNSITSLSHPEWETIHADSVNGAVGQYGYDSARFFDCRKNFDAAVSNLTKAINRSTAADPLYLLIAGPMEVPARALEKAELAKRPFVFCISHSRWNDGFDSNYKFKFNKRSIIEMDVRWVQLPDQNQRLSFGHFGTPAAANEFEPYFWLRDSHDEKLRFLWERMVISTRPDPSDAGMAWFMISGDETCEPPKIRRLLEDHQLPTPVTFRSKIRLEAENFRELNGCTVETSADRKSSHGLVVRLKDGAKTSRLRTIFNEPYARAGRYDVEICYHAESNSPSKFVLLVNDQACETWEGAAANNGWTTQVLRNVELRMGDELSLELKGASGAIDYVQLNKL